MQRLRSAWGAVRLTLALLLMVLTVPPASAAVLPCTLFLSPGPIPTWEAPGVVLCFHAGDYPHSDLRRITAIGAVYQAAPGEHARLIGPGLELSGHDFTLANLEIDNAGAGVPAIVLRGDHETLEHDDIHHGTYNGVDVRGQADTVSNSSLHDFDSGVPQSDAQCVNVISNNVAGSAGGFRLLGNAITNCSGDGLQAYHANVLPCPPSVAAGEISGNTFEAGTIPFLENAFDLKFDAWRVLSNTISGYGFIPQTGNNDTSPAGFIHKCAHNVLVSGNLFTHNGKGVEVLGNTGLDVGTWPISITVTGNTFVGTGPGYLFNVVGATQVITQPNAIDPTASTMPATATRVPSPTATATPLPSASATHTVSATPSSSPSATSTLPPTPTATPTLSGCWDLRQSPPRTIACP